MTSYMSAEKVPSVPHMKRMPSESRIDYRAQMIVDDERLWKDLQKKLKSNGAVTRFSIIEITGKFMEEHFEAATQDVRRRCSIEMIKRLPTSALEHYGAKQQAPKNQTFRELCDVGNIKDFDAPTNNALTLQSMMMHQASKLTNHPHHMPVPPRSISTSRPLTRTFSVRSSSHDSVGSIQASKASLFNALTQAASLAEELCAALVDEDLNMLSPPPPPPQPPKEHSQRSVVLSSLERPRRVHASTA